MGKIIFVLGGVRSGKSRFAVSIAGKTGKKIAFVATAEALDEEMKNRIHLHRKNRPKSWKTFEEFEKLSRVSKTVPAAFKTILIDCLTVLISNLILKDVKERDIESDIRKAIVLLKKRGGTVIIVSNEVGMGVVPEYELGRCFRDIQGKINQIVAASADEVFFVAAGIPMRMK
jgi:adenosylcobinamide kinase/adenosylcobinamide-phosphate guanylyltransferase